MKAKGERNWLSVCVSKRLYSVQCSAWRIYMRATCAYILCTRNSEGRERKRGGVRKKAFEEGEIKFQDSSSPGLS